MLDLKTRWEGIADRQKWAARRTSLMAKLNATRAVWFPPEPAKTAKSTATAAEKTHKRTSGAAKRSTGGTKKAKSPAAAKSA